MSKVEMDENARFAVQQWLEEATGNEARGLIGWMARSRGHGTLDQLLDYLETHDPPQRAALLKLVADDKRRLARLERDEILREACRRVAFPDGTPIKLTEWEESVVPIGCTGTDQRTGSVRVLSGDGYVTTMWVNLVTDASNGKVRAHEFSLSTTSVDRTALMRLMRELYLMLEVSRFMEVDARVFEHLHDYKRLEIKDGRTVLTPVAGVYLRSPETEGRPRDRSRSREREPKRA